jgi:integrase
LTEKTVERLGIKRNAYIVWDAAAVGLGLKITPRGKRIWLAQLKYPGHKVQTRRTLGLFPALGLAAARDKAAKWYALAKGGIDPAAAEEDERREAEATAIAAALRRQNTFAAFAEKCLAQRNNRRAKADAQEVRRMLIGAWGTKPIHEITPRDVRALIDKIKSRAPYDARNAWTHAVGIFKAAVHEELIEVSPCASLDRRQLFKNVKIEHRQRVLNETEIFAFWRASGRLGYPAGPFYRLLLLTGVRVNELVRATWSELHPELRRLLREARQTGNRIDWTEVSSQIKLWTVPRERFKSDAEHRVPLSNDALAILETLPRFAGCEYLFAVNGKTPVWPGTKFKRRLDARMVQTLRALARKRHDDPQVVTPPPWIIHDLRRVIRTNLAALDVADHVAEMVLGHACKGLQRVYDQHRYEPQIRDALEQWAKRLRTSVAPTPTPTDTNVVPLAPQRRRGRTR